MRALIVGNQPLGSPGGVEAVCRAWVDALTMCGFDTRYLSASDALSRTAADGWPLKRYWRSAAEVAATRLAAARAPAGVVVSNGSIGWGVRGSKASLHMYHGTYRGQAQVVGDAMSRRGRMKIGRIDGGLLERAAGRSKLCLANSWSTAAEVGRWYGHECEVLWPPVDVDRFRPGDGGRGPRGPFAPGDRPRGVFIGAGRPMKGERVAFEVMRRTPKIDWLVVGDKPGTPVPPLVSHIGSFDPREMPDLFRATDVLLVTSPYEPFGMVVAEAMACGTPVVCGPSGASDLLLSTDLSDWRVGSSDDVEAFAAVVNRLVLDKEGARVRALEHGRPLVVEHLSLARWRNRVSAIVERALRAG